MTYKFYVGKLSLMEDDFAAANEALTYALERCHPDKLKNRRLLVTYLVPARLCLGQMPSPALLQKYSLTKASNSNANPNSNSRRSTA